MEYIILHCIWAAVTVTTAYFVTSTIKHKETCKVQQEATRLALAPAREDDRHQPAGGTSANGNGTGHEYHYR